MHLSFRVPLLYNGISAVKEGSALLKRFFCILIAILLPCAVLADYTMAGYDDAATYRTWSSNRFFARMEERTGVRFSYVQYTKKQDWQKAKAAMKADDPDLPDVLFKANLTGSECIDLLEKGVLRLPSGFPGEWSS